ncbi:hypothetical protein SGPA1_40401 [Streptomyces misionensis JCM 4497]
MAPVHRRDPGSARPDPPLPPRHPDPAAPLPRRPAPAVLRIPPGPTSPLGRRVRRIRRGDPHHRRLLADLALRRQTLHLLGGPRRHPRLPRRLDLTDRRHGPGGPRVHPVASAGPRLRECRDGRGQPRRPGRGRDRRRPLRRPREPHQQRPLPAAGLRTADGLGGVRLFLGRVVKGGRRVTLGSPSRYEVVGAAVRAS